MLTGTLKSWRERVSRTQAERDQAKAVADEALAPLRRLEELNAALAEQAAQEAKIAARLDELRALRAPALETTEFWSGPNFDLLLKLHEGALLLEEAVKKNVAVAGLTVYTAAEFAARMHHQKAMVEAARENLARFDAEIRRLEG